ncbi:putative disease resistance protein RGA3 isoform X2 [Carex rostrata]
MAGTPILAPFGWLVAPLFKSISDKVYDHLGTYIFNKARDHISSGTGPSIEKKRKLLQAEILPILPRLSLAIDKAEKSPKKEKLMDWLERLKAAYYEAEEAIDLLDYEQLEQKVMDDRKTLEQTEKNERRIPYLSRPPKNASLKSKYGVELKSCIDKLKNLEEEAEEFRDLLVSNENDRDTFSEPPSRVFGREKDKENIVGLLMKEPLNSEAGPSIRPAIPIIAITGRSGVGKTALAQYVHKHMDEQDHFDLAVWVHVPRKFEATDVIKKILETIEAKEHTPTNNPSASLESLLLQIRRMLGSKKILLVLDDFWSDNEDFVAQWENVIGCLTTCSPGSKILLTTQSKNTTHQVGLAGVTEVETYNLNEIEEDHFLELFMHYAWPSNSHLQKVEFEKIGQKISVKLKGDPGAAKLVGHQLSGKLDLRHWEEVAEKDWLGDNMKARIWSYQQLPLDLQRCFALCSLFPKGFMLQRQFLINLWMAEGFIRPRDKEERLEDIGENYLHELVSRFFIEEVVDHKKGEIYYELHDLLHDLAEHVQGDDFIRIDSFNFREIPTHISDMLSRSENIRHILLPSSIINELKETLCLMKNIRTFFVVADSFVPKKVLQEVLKHMKKLRVLDLSYCVDDLPDYIGNLKHLRSLDINGSRPIKKLPNSICKLYHLQTLVLPKYCESLPNDISELISLRRFENFWGMSHISNVGRLTSLQCLDQFLARKEHGNELHQLENLNQLRGEMRISGLENVRNIADAVKANMQNKKYLEKLHFKWSSDERDTHNVTGLFTQHVQLLDALQPHPNTSALTLIGFKGERFPNWLLSRNSLEHLTSLTLMNCDKVEGISSIDESLPKCRSLILWGLKNLKKMPLLPPNLTNLVIDHLPQLSYFSEDDLLMKEERKKSKLEDMKKVAECLKLKQQVSLYGGLFLQFAKDKLEAGPEIRIRNSQNVNIFWKIVNCDPISDDYSQTQLLNEWIVFMRDHIETMFDRNEEPQLVLPSSLTDLQISSCRITSDALTTSIQCLVSLSKLKLFDIQTITSLPPKEVLCLLKNLRSLTIEGCHLLSSLGGIGALSSLIALELNGCLNLSTSNEPLASSLEKLKFWDCSNVDVILAKSNLPELRALTVFNDLKNRREVLLVGHLSRLENLTITGWNVHLEGLNSLTTLYSLHVTTNLEINLSSPMEKYARALAVVYVDNILLLKLMLSNETISSIDTLSIGLFKGDSLDDEVFQSLTSLERLYFYDCNITHLPKNLKNLQSLQLMKIKNCPNLYELEELPRNLRELYIEDCPTLTKKFNKGGPYRVRSHEGSTVVKFLTEEEGNRF